MHSLFRGLLVLLAMLALAGPAAAQITLPSLTAPAASPTPTPLPTPAPDLSPEAAARALIGILGDEAARARLVEELEALAARPTPTPGEEAAAAGAASPATAQTEPLDSTIARELGSFTQRVTADAVQIGTRVWTELSYLVGVLNGSAVIDWEQLAAQLRSLAVLAVMLYGLYHLLRWLAGWPLRALDRRAGRHGFARRAALLGAAIVIELACLVLAWFATLVYLVVSTGAPRIGLVETYFFNAVALVEVVRIGLRAVFEPRLAALRLLPIPTAAARYWNRRLGFLTAFTVFGVLLVFPIVNTSVSFAVGLGVRLAIVLVALVSMIVLVLRNRVQVHDGLVALSATLDPGAGAAGVVLLARVWHLLVITHLVTAFLVWTTRPLDAVGFMASATIQTLVALAAGGTLSSLLARSIESGIRLPADVKQALPLLEDRLNLLVPTVLRILRLLLLALVVAVILQAWTLVDFLGWIASDAGGAMVGRIVSAVILLLVAMGIWIAATSWIEFRLNPATGRVSTPRTRTLFALFRNAFTILLVVITGMLVLSELGVDIAPLIAGAGVLGLAIGIGSQKLVQDIITGAFIQFENAMNEGDVVTVAGISGVVEHLTIRSVGLRDVNGVFHVIPFSSVDSVSNSMRGFAFHVADVSVGYQEDVGAVKRLMGVAFERLMDSVHAPSILEPLDVQGVIAFAANAVVVRARIKTLPGQQWAVGRAYNELIKSVFDENGIEIPVPQTTLRVAEPRPDAEVLARRAIHPPPQVPSPGDPADGGAPARP